MCGRYVYFHCAKCNYNSIIDLGFTNLVKYKGKELALTNCPKCKTKIAFNMIDVGLRNLGNAQLNSYGAYMKEDIINIISSNLTILKKNEDQIVGFVLNKLKDTYSDNYLNQNAYEIRTILEYVLSNNLFVESYIFDTIKNDCNNSGCACY